MSGHLRGADGQAVIAACLLEARHVAPLRIAASTVWSILQKAEIEPSPRRPSETSRQFLRAQASGIVSCAFFSIDTVLLRHLYALVFIDLASQQMYLAGITANPTGWND